MLKKLTERKRKVGKIVERNAAYICAWDCKLSCLDSVDKYQELYLIDAWMT